MISVPFLWMESVCCNVNEGLIKEAQLSVGAVGRVF
jgi:hypothetical protein